jgi:hypothetical protein
MNNGKRIDRFNSKKIRKELLLNTGNLSTLGQNGLLQFDFEGEIKVVASSNPGWLLIDKDDNGAGVNPPPIDPLEQYTFILSTDNLIQIIPVWISGAIQLGKTPYTSDNGTGLLENGTYDYFPDNSAATKSYDVIILDGVIIQYSEKEEKK